MHIKSKKCNINYDKYDIIFVFLIGGLLGTVYEIALNFILHGIIEDRSGSVLMPCNYVYGIGAVLILIILGHIKNDIALFLSGTFLGGMFEYTISVMQQYLLGSRSWDYSDKLLNVNGRTTIPFMLFWGVLGCTAIRIIFPIYIKAIHKISNKIRCGTAVFLFVFMIFDIVITVIAVIRYSQRANGIFYDISFFQVIDQIFDDGFMKRHFPNMIL